MNDYVSGGISGAITEPLSEEAIRHANMYYEEIRHRTDDVKKIADFTGYTQEQVLKVKNYLFFETHILEDGIRRFDVSFEIAESWQRLSDMQEYVQEHDKLLIPHELREMELITLGLTQKRAHEETCRFYDYPRESVAFYNRLSSEKNAHIGKGNIISGAVDYYQRDDWELYL